MAFHVIYFLVLLAYGIWVVSLITRNEIVALLSCLMLFPLSIYIFVNGMDIFEWSNIIVKVFAAITFAVASYTSLQATFEMFDKNYN